MNSLLDEQLALSGYLNQLELSALSTLIKNRPVAKLTRDSSFFELAQELLSEKNIQQALRLITWENAVALVTASTPPPEQFLELALAHPEYGIYPTVLNLVKKLESPTPNEAPGSQLIETELDATEQSQSAAAAFSATSSLSELLWRIQRTPIPRNANGTLHMAERRRLREAGFGDGNHFPAALLHTALIAGLIRDEPEWVLSDQGVEWLRQNKLQRWERIRDSLIEQLGDKLSQGNALLKPAIWPELYPWDSDWARQSSLWQSELTQWGLISENGKLNPWAILSAEADEASTQILQSHFPTEVQEVYLQQDLSIIAAGTLAAAIDFRLRTMSVSGNSSQASSYQISAASLANAMTFSETPEQIREFLSEISIHPLPQPLAFELAELEAKHQALSLKTVDGETVLTSSDQNLLATIESNPDLSHLTWHRRSDNTLHTSWHLPDVARALVTSRIPSRIESEPKLGAAANKHLDVLSLSDSEQILTAMIENRPERGSPRWIQELLEPLVRHRENVRIELVSSQGEKLEFQIELRGISSQRVRGVDHAAASERTVPLNAITHIFKGDQSLFQP